MTADNITEEKAQHPGVFRSIFDALQGKISYPLSADACQRLQLEFKKAHLSYPEEALNTNFEVVLLKSGSWESIHVAVEKKLPFHNNQVLVSKLSKDWHRFYFRVHALDRAIISNTQCISEAALLDEINVLKSQKKELIERSRFLQADQRRMNDIVNKLKIDWNNESHLKAWDLQNDRCWHGWGGVEVIFHDVNNNTKRKYRIPTRIKALMQIASEPIFDKRGSRINLLLEKMHQAKLKPAPFYNPFSWMTRSVVTQKVYDLDPENLFSFEFIPPKRR